MVQMENGMHLLHTCVFWVLNPPNVNNPKWWNHKPEKKFGVPEIHYVHPLQSREIAEINGTIIFFKSDKNGDITRKLSTMEIQANENLEMHHNSSYI